MATSTVKRATPTALDASEYTVTPASGFTWSVVEIHEIQPDVFYLHLNVYGDYPKHTFTVPGELRIRGKYPRANQLHCRIGIDQATLTVTEAQWLSSGGIRVVNDTDVNKTAQTAYIDGLVLLAP